MNKSESIKELATALAAFNGEVSRVAKDRSNPFFKNNYATLDQIIDEVRPILHKNGLSIMQIPSGEADNVTLKTLLMHVSGEWIESEPVAMKPVKNDPQSVGSAITYARRYSLAAFLSLNTGEDDDGNAASQSKAPTASNKPTEQPQRSSSTSDKASEAQIKKLNTVISKLTEFGGSRDQVCDTLKQKQDVGKFHSLNDLTKNQASAAIKYVEGWIQTKERSGQAQ
ncbi:ERF family protein [Brevibacillus choshinensis]|uniref:ERF family protein n=1 Tax=Brevibacillus choshinensis TaxID=54911 RepID=UPI002E1FA574|nr:ERF family protein [Brevibacillus choshinensis]